MNNQNDLFYDTPPLSPILYQGDLGDEVPILEFDVSELDDDINLSELDDDINLSDLPNLDDDINLSDLEFDENLVDDLGVFTPPSSPKSVFNAPKTISDIFDFFFYR